MYRRFQIPALASLILRPGPIFGGGRIPHPADLVRRVYRPQLHWALNHGWIVIGVALALLAVAALVAPTLGTEFLPTMDEGSVVVQPFQIPSVSLDQSLATVRLIEATIMELAYLAYLMLRQGKLTQEEADNHERCNCATERPSRRKERHQQTAPLMFSGGDHRRDVGKTHVTIYLNRHIRFVFTQKSPAIGNLAQRRGVAVG